MTDSISWRGLQFERQPEYRSDRYAYLAMGGAWWIVERLEESKGWIAFLILSERARFMSPGETPTAALEGVYADALKLDGQLRHTLGEVTPDDREP